MNTTPTGEENSILRLLIRKCNQINQKREKPRKLSYLIDYLKTPESKTFFNNLNSKERDLIKIKYGLDDGKLKRELKKAGNLELILESMNIISEAEVKATEYLYYWWVN